MKNILLALAILSNIAIANTINIQSLKWTEDFETLVNLSSTTENTLKGLDQNNNGVRDDVEFYIESKWENRPFQKAIFTKAANTLQKIITLAEDSAIEEHQKLDRELLNLYTCRDYILYKMNSDSLNEEMLEKTAFKGKVLNTQKRLHAYITHKKLLPFHFDDLSEIELEHDKSTCILQYNKYKNVDAGLISSN